MLFFSGIYKPPVAPKPKLPHDDTLGSSSPTIHQGSGHSPLCLGTPRRTKPALAPKPCLSKLSPAVESKHQTVHFNNSQNVNPQENKKPDWDYIIPICLCSQENCTCIRTSSTNVTKMEGDLKAAYLQNDAEESKITHFTSQGISKNRRFKKDNLSQQVRDTFSTTTQATDHKAPRDPPPSDERINICTDALVPVTRPQRWRSDELNANLLPHNAPQEDDPIPQAHLVPVSPNNPVPVPRKPWKSALANQETVKEDKEETPNWRETDVKEVKMSSERRSNSSMPVSENRMPRNASAPPAPPPRKKPFLSKPETAQTSAQVFPKSVNDRGWDWGMEISVDDGEEELLWKRTDEKNSGDENLTHRPHTPSVGLPAMPCRLPVITIAAVDNVVTKVAPKKPQRLRCSQAEGLPPEKDLQQSGDEMKSPVHQQLPLKEKTRKNSLTPSVLKPPRSNLIKPKSKSFSASDFIRSDGQRRNSFRRLLDLKLSVPKMLPKLTALRGQRSDSSDRDHGQSPQMNQDNHTNLQEDPSRSKRKSSWPLIGVEQSVDGDVFSPGPGEASYENVNHYEEIADYVNVDVGKAVSLPSWTSSTYSDEGIYEEQEPYMSLVKTTSQQQSVPPASILFLSHKQDFRDVVSQASRQSGKPVIEERLLNQILYYLPQLYELNQDLLLELKQRVSNWDDNDQLADVFLKKGPYLKMYSTYIREFDRNVALLDEQMKRNSAFGAVVQTFEASSRCANLALKHYLLKPVQRIPQYQLLLTDYLKNLSEESHDYKDTQAALALVKEVANHANDIMKQGDNFQKLIQVQCRLNGQHEIVQPGRIFLKEGTLKKLSRKVMQPRMFFLFNDTLLYTTPLQSGQFRLNNMLSLSGMKVSKPSQEVNELNIESVQRSFILSASSATERDEWLHAISTAINDYTKKKISFVSGKPLHEVNYEAGAPLGSKAPIWIPDPRATMCMICTCEFSLTWRRHHCRACGKVVCHTCSTNKHSLEYLKNQEARVCDHCFPTLQKERSKSTSSRVTCNLSNNVRKQKKIPAALKAVSANIENSSMSGYLMRSKSNKKQGKRLWFVIKDKVLYTYAASEDVAALESQPLLGFVLKVDSPQTLSIQLYHKKTLYYIFKADDIQTAQRWMDSFKEATVL
uniref:FYVE, RhoGEF and PH domain-containing protein 6-like n=1 Tax=Gouania willdenowi TaxID=441366 RepID=A0A8C5GF43_GOUWI